MTKSTKAPVAAEVADDVRLIAEHLATIPGVKRVWLFGGAARGRRLDWRSDLDVAAEGLPAEDLAWVWSQLDARLARPLDLIRWEQASQPLRLEIQRWGILLHEA